LEKITLIPLKGLAFENNETIGFGTSKARLFTLLGKPSVEFEKQLFYDDLELRIDLDRSGRIEFIEFIYGPFPEKTEIEIYGINPFKTESSELIKVLTKQNNGAVNEAEAPYCHAFLESSIGVFRDSCEADVKEVIDKMKANGEYATNEVWLNEDREKAKYFWTVGIGKKDYYK